MVPVNLMVYRDFRFLVHDDDDDGDDDDDDDDDDDVLVCWTGCYIAKGNIFCGDLASSNSPLLIWTT